MNHVSRIFSYLMVFAALIMAGWGTLGFIEYFTGHAILMPLQNANFPSGTQFLHWLIISVAGYTLLLGYFLRWKYTPNVMVGIFACLATMCFIQTFDFMTREDRYSAYAREVIYYIIFSVYLLKSKLMQKHFGRIN
ncbi:MAG: hypothetical protein AB2559_20240 [Candidatus Thiodiazotropha endolucinida]